MHCVGEGFGLTGQDQAGQTILGPENVVGRHLDLAGYDAAHARTAPPLAARVGHVDARRKQHVDERGLARPLDAMALAVEIHFSYGHGQ